MVFHKLSICAHLIFCGQGVQMDKKGSKTESPATTKIHDFGSGPARPGSAGGAQMEPRQSLDGAWTEPGRSPDGARAEPGRSPDVPEFFAISVGWPMALYVPPPPPPRNRRGIGTTFTWNLRGICVEFARYLRRICAEFALHLRGFPRTLHRM